MKESKLNQYGEFIMAKAKSGNSISKIRRDLFAKGCTVSNSRLTQWIETVAAKEGIELPPRKRGRPIESKPAMFAFLPKEGEALSQIPLFILALQEMPEQMRRVVRDHALYQLGLPKSGSPFPREPSEVERLTNLSDVELCLLALLLSNLPAPPLSKGPEALTAWFSELVKFASKLRLTIRTASESSKE